MQRKTVYLGGPIAGLTEAQAKTWRAGVQEQLMEANIEGISPLRCEPALEGVYDVPQGAQLNDPCFGSPRAIAAKNEFDIRHCDMILVYFPPLAGKTSLAVPSVGTTIELGWAYGLGKSIVFVTRDKYLKAHPLVQHCASWSLDTLEEAVEVITGILGDYA
jgi:nucleoside 2-deoxyribosyltransferase